MDERIAIDALDAGLGPDRVLQLLAVVGRAAGIGIALVDGRGDVAHLGRSGD